MKPGKFVTILVPLVMVAHVLVVWFTYIVALRYCDLTPDSSTIHRACVKTAILALWLPGILYLIRFLYGVLSRSSGHFYSFYFPIIDEVMKLAFCAAFAAFAGRHTAAVQLPIAVLVFNSMTLLSTLPSLSLSGYHDRYATFLDLHLKWLGRTTTKARFDDQTRKASVVLDNILALQNDRKESDTAILVDSISSSQMSSRVAASELPRAFSVSDQPCDYDSLKPLSSCAAPMQRSEVSHNTIRSVRSVGTFQSSYDVVDRLYSVSPKNTFHLDIHAVAALDEPSPLSPELISTTFLDTTEYHDLAPDPVATIPHDGQYQHNSHSPLEQSLSQVVSSIEKPHNQLVKVLNWFSWLVPPLLPIYSDSGTLTKAQENEAFPLLRSRLSRYSIVLPQDGNQYGSVDLESCQPRARRVLLAARIGMESIGFAGFRYFACFYYDYSQNLGHLSSLAIDPIFKRFGQLLPDMPVKYIALDIGVGLMASALSFSVYAILVHHWFSHGMDYSVLVVLGMITLRLFSLNYLHGQEMPFPYKVLIISDLLLNIIGILVMVIYLY